MAATFDPTTNQVFAAGYVDAPLANLPCLHGSGGVVSFKWDLNNGNVTCYTCYGSFAGNLAGGVGYDSASGTLVLSGHVQGFATVYGDFDGLVLIYNKNGDLMNASVIGGSGSDSASAVSLPYVLLSIPTAPAPQFGTKAGPGLLSIALPTFTSITTLKPTTTSTTTFTIIATSS